jgi:endoglucanase
MTWLQAKASQGKYARGIFTEYAVPDDDSRWFTVLDNFLSYVEAQPLLIGGTYWAAGTGWCSSADKIHVEPCKGLDRPQEPTLARHPTR